MTSSINHPYTHRPPLLVSNAQRGHDFGSTLCRTEKVDRLDPNIDELLEEVTRGATLRRSELDVSYRYKLNYPAASIAIDAILLTWHVYLGIATWFGVTIFLTTTVLVLLNITIRYKRGEAMLTKNTSLTFANQIVLSLGAGAIGLSNPGMFHYTMALMLLAFVFGFASLRLWMLIAIAVWQSAILTTIILIYSDRLYLPTNSSTQCYALGCVAVSVIARFATIGHYTHRLMVRYDAEREEHMTSLESARRFASTDPLTGALNRWSLVHLTDRAAEQYKLTGQAYAIAMVDLDHFKSVNDRFGHPAGDRVLSAFSALLMSTVRPDDFICRIGGEEFMIVLTDVDRPTVTSIMARIHQVIESFDWATVVPTIITASAGASIATKDDDVASVVQRADDALYIAKQNRNKVVVYEDALAE